MSLEALKRVVWRLRELKLEKVSLKQLRRAIMAEIGTDERTIKLTINKLKELELVTETCMYDLTTESLDEVF